MTPLRVCMLGVFKPDYSRHWVIREGLERVGVQVTSQHLPREKRTLGRLAALLRRFPEAARADVIFVPATNQALAPFAWGLGRLYRKPILLDYYLGLTDVNEDRQEFTGLKAAAFRWVDRFNIARLPTITDTAQHREAFRRLFGSGLDGNLDRMGIVPIGVKDNLFTSLPLPEGQDRVIVHFVGTFVPFQGIDVILRAAALLRDAPHIHFELMGGGQTFDASVRLAQELALDNVSFPGFVRPPELLDRLAQGSIYLGVFGNAPKTRYVVPNKVFEGMALARPVVTAQSPALDEFFTPGQHFVPVPPDNPERLAEAIRRLAASPGECARIGASAAARIQEAFLPQHIGALLMPTLERLAATGQVA